MKESTLLKEFSNWRIIRSFSESLAWFFDLLSRKIKRNILKNFVAMTENEYFILLELIRAEP
jgi:hypothetical protein